MKFAITLFLMIFAVTVVVSKPQHSKRCSTDMWGRYSHECPEGISECPVGTHRFVSSCGGGPTPSVPTCSSPKVRDLGWICDLIRCDCDTPTILDETTGKCVQPEDCPK